MFRWLQNLVCTISRVWEQCPGAQNHVWKKFENRSFWGHSGTFSEIAAKKIFFPKIKFCSNYRLLFSILFQLPPPFFLSRLFSKIQNVHFRPKNEGRLKYSIRSETSSTTCSKVGSNVWLIINNFGIFCKIVLFHAIYAHFPENVPIWARIDHFEKYCDDLQTSSAPCPECGSSAPTIGNKFW